MQDLQLELRARAPEACCLSPEVQSVWVQAFRVAHKPVRGNFWSRPKVHRGFQAAWRNNSLHDRVIDRIKEIINSGYIVTKGLRFHVTGGRTPPSCSFRLLIGACCCPKHSTGPASRGRA